MRNLNDMVAPALICLARVTSIMTDVDTVIEK